MLYLIASLVALALGPLLAIGARRYRSSAIVLDAFTLVVLGGLVVLHILPHALEGAGGFALLAALAAFALAGLAERSLRSGEFAAGGRVGRRLFFLLTLIGLGFHAIVDGLALTGAVVHGDHVHLPDGASHDNGGSIMALAVLLHRVPFAIGLWWIVAPLIGARIAILCMLVLGGGTVVGFAMGDTLLGGASPWSLALFEAVLCGTLMHVVLHADLPPPPRGASPWLIRGATLLGLGAGGAVVYAVEAGSGHSHGSANGPGIVSTFVGLALETAPALLIAYLAVGLAQGFVPQGFVRRATSGRPLGEALRGMAIGLPLPVCSCGVVPMYRDLVRQGASMAAGIAFLIATPELEFAAVLLTWQLLGAELAIARVAAAALLAIVVAVVLARIAQRRSAATAEHLENVLPPPPIGLGARLRTTVRAGFGEAVDETAAWILLGLGLAAFLTPLLDPGALAGFPSWLGVPVAALIGMPLYVCASGSTPLAAVLVAKGLSPGAAIAFLLTGPATNVTTFGVLARLHDRRIAIAFAALTLLGASIAGWTTDALVGSIALPAAAAFGHADGSLLQWICLALLAVVVLASLLRQGIRRFVGQIFDTPSLAELTGTGPRMPNCGPGDDHGHHHGHHHPH